MPQTQADYIKHWMELHPTWQIMRWDEKTFPLSFCEYTNLAAKKRKWAFVSDVARLYVLQKYGGVYLDTDVELFSPLDSFLDNSLFSGVEIYPTEFEKYGKPLLDAEGAPLNHSDGIPYCGFLSAILGSTPDHLLINALLNHYQGLSFQGMVELFQGEVIDGLLASHAVEHGFRYVDCLQRLPLMTIYPSSTFAYPGVPLTSQAVAYHHTVQSWTPKTATQKAFMWLDKAHLLKPYRTLKQRIKR